MSRRWCNHHRFSQSYDLSVSNATDKYFALFSLGYKKNNGIPISSCCFLFILFVVYHCFA